MRILINHVSPVANVITGITAYTWSITEALARADGHEVFLCTNWDRDFVPAAIRNTATDIIHAPTAKNESAAFLQRAIALPGLERKHAFDVIFTPHYYQVPLSRAARVTVVHDFYILAYPAYFRWTRHLQWNAIFPLSLRRSDMVVCVSGATQDELFKYYKVDPAKVAIVHEASALSSSAKASADRPVDEPYGLMVANLEATKNVTQLFEALRLLQSEGSTPRIVLVGSDRTGAVSAFCAQEPGVRLTHIPRVSDDQLASLYKHARCYINTSLSEGFCLPILEAQSFGTPVICSDIPVLHEVAGTGALFVPPTDPHALKVAIRRAFAEDDLAARLSHAGIVNAQRFSWDRAARETLSAFESAIARRRSRTP